MAALCTPAPYQERKGQEPGRQPGAPGLSPAFLTVPLLTPANYAGLFFLSPSEGGRLALGTQKWEVFSYEQWNAVSAVSNS